MKLEDQVAAVREFGYSPREAAFVVAAALHAGCFLRRQYTMTRGKTATKLCRKIIRLRHGQPQAFAHNVHLMRLSGKPLYMVLGQDDNRHRRRHELSYLRSKLMGFDYVLDHGRYLFLPTEDAKTEYFCQRRALPLGIMPAKVYTAADGKTKTERYFTEKYPVRIDPSTDKVSFCWVDDGFGSPPGFATWLSQYEPLLRAMGETEVICVAGSQTAFPPARREFLKRFPSPGSVADALLEYFTQREDMERAGAGGRTQAQLDSYRALARRYAGHRTDEQYGAWRRSKDEPAAPPAISFSTYQLRHSYAWLGSALAGEGNHE